LRIGLSLTSSNMVRHGWRGITIRNFTRNSRTLNKSQMKRCDHMREATTILTKRSKQFRLGKWRLSKSLSNQSAPCCRPRLSRGSCRVCPFAKLNSLKSWMGQNVNSPFSNICAVTFKLYFRSSRIAAANRLTFSSRPLASSP
jgi:hypothetical protein